MSIKTEYGHEIEIRESSVATARMGWMWIRNDGSKSGCENFKLDDAIGVHVTEQQAAEIRDELTTWLGGDLPVLTMKSFELWVESLDGLDLAKAHKILSQRVTEQLELFDC